MPGSLRHKLDGYGEISDSELCKRRTRPSLVIAIGCTGGKHRSVTLARVLYDRLIETREYGIRLEHRDIGKDALLKK